MKKFLITFVVDNPDLKERQLRRFAASVLALSERNLTIDEEVLPVSNLRVIGPSMDLSKDYHKIIPDIPTVVIQTFPKKLDLDMLKTFIDTNISFVLSNNDFSKSSLVRNVVLKTITGINTTNLDTYPWGAVNQTCDVKSDLKKAKIIDQLKIERMDKKCLKEISKFSDYAKKCESLSKIQIENGYLNIDGNNVRINFYFKVKKNLKTKSIMNFLNLFESMGLNHQLIVNGISEHSIEISYVIPMHANQYQYDLGKVIAYISK